MYRGTSIAPLGDHGPASGYKIVQSAAMVLCNGSPLFQVPKVGTYENGCHTRAPKGGGLTLLHNPCCIRDPKVEKSWIVPRIALVGGELAYKDAWHLAWRRPSLCKGNQGQGTQRPTEQEVAPLAQPPVSSHSLTGVILIAAKSTANHIRKHKKVQIQAECCFEQQQLFTGMTQPSFPLQLAHIPPPLLKYPPPLCRGPKALKKIFLRLSGRAAVLVLPLHVAVQGERGQNDISPCHP